MEHLNDIADYLLANPVFLVPLLILVAVALFAILKKLLKLAAILAIAGVLYLLMVEYLGPGF